MQLKSTEEFEKWFASQPQLMQGRIDGALRVFERVLHRIDEPHGAQVGSSRHSPDVYVLYPVRKGVARIVYCFLRDSTIYIINGYDPNVNLDLQSMVEEIDKIIDRIDPLQ